MMGSAPFAGRSAGAVSPVRGRAGSSHSPSRVCELSTIPRGVHRFWPRAPRCRTDTYRGPHDHAPCSIHRFPFPFASPFPGPYLFVVLLLLGLFGRLGRPPRRVRRTRSRAGLRRAHPCPASLPAACPRADTPGPYGSGARARGAALRAGCRARPGRRPAGRGPRGAGPGGRTGGDLGDRPCGRDGAGTGEGRGARRDEGTGTGEGPGDRTDERPGSDGDDGDPAAGRRAGPGRAVDPPAGDPPGRGGARAAPFAPRRSCRFEGVVTRRGERR